MNFSEELKERTRQTEEIIREQLPPEEGQQRVIMEAMNYSVLAGGKRLRPLLMRETYRMFGGKGDTIRPFMAAMEMIHTYSLVHDDLPAMDDDEYRRNRKTTHIVYGEDMGILAGDALLNFAFETACKAFSMEGADAARIGKALGILAGKAGIYGMVGGQVVDVQSTGKEISGETLDFIYRLKTGALLEVSMMIGAILGGADREQVKAVEKMASCVGTAFQIQDDILDVVGDARVIGKPVLSDEKNEKTTYVTLYGMEAARKAVMELSKEAEEILESLPGDHEFLSCLIDILITRVK